MPYLFLKTLSISYNILCIKLICLMIYSDTRQTSNTQIFARGEFVQGVLPKFPLSVNIVGSLDSNYYCPFKVVPLGIQWVQFRC